MPSAPGVSIPLRLETGECLRISAVSRTAISLMAGVITPTCATTSAIVKPSVAMDGTNGTAVPMKLSSLRQIAPFTTRTRVPSRQPPRILIITVDTIWICPLRVHTIGTVMDNATLAGAWVSHR